MDSRRIRKKQTESNGSSAASEALNMALSGHRLVKLVDGRIVCNYSQEYAAQCLAQYLLRKPLRKRRQLLMDFEDSWGVAKLNDIKRFMLILHKQQHTN